MTINPYPENNWDKEEEYIKQCIARWNEASKNDN